MSASQLKTAQWLVKTVWCKLSALTWCYSCMTLQDKSRQLDTSPRKMTCMNCYWQLRLKPSFRILFFIWFFLKVKNHIIQKPEFYQYIFIHMLYSHTYIHHHHTVTAFQFSICVTAFRDKPGLSSKWTPASKDKSLFPLWTTLSGTAWKVDSDWVLTFLHTIC